MLTRRELAHAGCGDPDCPDPHDDEELVLGSRCHPGGKQRARLLNDGELGVVCAACYRPICTVGVELPAELAAAPDLVCTVVYRKGPGRLELRDGDQVLHAFDVLECPPSRAPGLAEA